MISVDEYSDISSEDSRSPESKLIAKETKQYLASLFGNECLSDLTVVVGDQRIKAHKLIFTMRSTVFNAMLQSDCKESAESQVVITDYEYDVVMQMMEFMYTGNASKIHSMTEDLIKISEKYNLSILKAKCEKALVRQLCVKNVLDMIDLADKYKAPQLEKAAIDFVKIHYKDVRVTEEWKNVSQHVKDKIIDDYANFSPTKKKQKSSHM